MAKIWKEYILKFDNLLLESLKICSRHSLERIYGILHWDGTAKQSFLLHVDLELNNQKVSWMLSIIAFFQSNYILIHRLIVKHVADSCGNIRLLRQHSRNPKIVHLVHSSPLRKSRRSSSSRSSGVRAVDLNRRGMQSIVQSNQRRIEIQSRSSQYVHASMGALR